jgi:hypothetical protein
VASSKIAFNTLRAVALVVLWTGCGNINVTPPPLRKDDGGRTDTGQPDLAQPDVTPPDDGPLEQQPLTERHPSGSACTEAAQCASGFCVDGVCCRFACQGECVSCNQPGREGFCWPVDQGAPDPHALCTDQGPASCGIKSTCNGVGGCATYDPGTACAPSSICVAGACRPLPSVVLAATAPTPEIGGVHFDTPMEDKCPAGAAVIGFDATETSDESPYVGRIRTVCGALVVTHVGPSISIEVGATTALVVRGTGTGTTMSLRCPKNQVVIGYEGRSGSWVDQLSFRCAPLALVNKDTEVVLGPVTKIGPVGGGGGGARGEIDCGASEVAVGSRVLAESVVKVFALPCAKVSLR